MFYVKANENVEENGIIFLTEDNVYTTCLDCEKEFTVDLSELFSEIVGADFYSINIRCDECSAKFIKEHEE